MKFVVAVVMLACAVGVQSSLYAAHAPAVSYVTSVAHPAAGWGHGGWGGPWGGAWDHSGAGHWGGHAAVAVHAAGPWGHSGYGGYPGISLSQGPSAHGGAHLAYAGAAHHGHEGVYVAKTRGAVHTAPLAGHINSATSLNLAAAPGTH